MKQVEHISKMSRSTVKYACDCTDRHKTHSALHHYVQTSYAKFNSY